MAIDHFLAKSYKVAFIHGRPKGHPIHALYANQLCASFIYEDFILRWHDKPRALKIRRYLSWVLCAFLFPIKGSFDIYFTECIRIPQLIMKLFGLINGRRKLIALMADESLYFILNKRYSLLTIKLMKLFLIKTDAIICIGQMQTDIAKIVLDKIHHGKIHTIYNGVPHLRHQMLMRIKPELTSNNILCIANAATEWRILYKGIDVMIESFFFAFLLKIYLKF